MLIRTNQYRLFKFRALNDYLWRSLEDGTIYFAQPSKLNDPYDCRVDILAALENAISRSTGGSRATLQRLRGMRDFFEQLAHDIARVGVCSFSLELSNSLLWAHYAAGHRGICLLYEFPEAFFYERKDRILGVDRVLYGANPLSDWLIEWAPNHGPFDEFRDGLATKALTVKAGAWSYEREARILRKEEGIEVLDRRFLKQVCFGLSTDEADVRRTTDLLARSGYDGVTLCRMRRHPGSDFGIEIVEI